MQTQVYEGMFIFDSNKYAHNQAELPAEVETMITEAGGEVIVSRLWEERRLAYAIDGQRKGTYWLIYFRSPTDLIVGLNRQCEIHDSILRQLILKIHPRLVEPILSHASGQAEAEESEGEGDGSDPNSADAETTESAAPSAE